MKKVRFGPFNRQLPISFPSVITNPPGPLSSILGTLPSGVQFPVLVTPSMQGGPNMGVSNPAPPSSDIINKYQHLVQNPSESQYYLQPQSQGYNYAVGCDFRWTIILLKNGQLFLMYVTSASPTGNTAGWLWPSMTMGSFPTSNIFAYQCN